MRVLLIPAGHGEPKLLDIPDSHRQTGLYIRPEHFRLVTYRWRGAIARVNGSIVCDIFEADE